jgi:hypothetical protein
MLRFALYAMALVWAEGGVFRIVTLRFVNRGPVHVCEACGTIIFSCAYVEFYVYLTKGVEIIYVSGNLPLLKIKKILHTLRYGLYICVHH